MKYYWDPEKQQMMEVIGPVSRHEVALEAETAAADLAEFDEIMAAVHQAEDQVLKENAAEDAAAAAPAEPAAPAPDPAPAAAERPAGIVDPEANLDKSVTPPTMPAPGTPAQSPAAETVAAPAADPAAAALAEKPATANPDEHAKAGSDEFGDAPVEREFE